MPPVPRAEPYGVLWSLVPFLTFGMGTPFSFLYAAARRRSWQLAAAAGGYGGALAVVFQTLVLGDALGAHIFGLLLLTITCIVGTTHAFVIRPEVYPRSTPEERLNRHAIEIARYQRTLREEARKIACEDPALAHELGIGRPDLPRTYDDGGLIDVNHAPAPTLRLLPGLSDEQVRRIVQVRQAQGGFVSVEELAVDVNLPPDLTTQIAEYTIFLR